MFAQLPYLREGAEFSSEWNSYEISKVRNEFVGKKEAPTNKRGKVYEGRELSDAEVHDHGIRLLIYASTLKHAPARA